MNAKEAIERIGNRLASLEFKKKELAYPMTEEEKYVFLMDIEALSIVLESARVFHEHVIPQMESQYKKLGHDYKSVYGISLKKLGLEKGEDE